jgi:hypothetical protein
LMVMKPVIVHMHLYPLSGCCWHGCPSLFLLRRHSGFPMLVLTPWDSPSPRVSFWNSAIQNSDTVGLPCW